MTRQFINPHAHSDHSLDGAATVEQIVKRNKELGATHVTLTEHGHFNSAMELYFLADKYKVKPILGIEVYLETPFKEELRQCFEESVSDDDSARKKRKIDRKIAESYTHLTIHFKDAWAYQYFCQATPIMEQNAVVRYGARKPMISFEMLAAAAGHITIGTGCLLGPSNFWIAPQYNRTDLAEKVYCMLRDIAGSGNFFVEILPHRINTEWQRPVKGEGGKVIKAGFFQPIPSTELMPDGDRQAHCNRFMLAMAKKYSDPCLISLDSHYAYPEQSVIQNARLGKGTGQWQADEGYHIMSTEEAATILKETLDLTESDIQTMVDNSYGFASLFDGFKIPTYQDRWVLNELPSDSMVKLNQLINKYERMDWNDTVMVERLQQEIEVLCFNGSINLLPYFFTIEEMADFCRTNNILINVRGSAAGSLLLFLIGVCAINPLKHELSFERFLTKGRIQAKVLPDVDIDVSADGRKLLLQHLRDKYGDSFCQLSIDSMLKLKSSIRDAERYKYGAVSKSTEKLCKTLPDAPQGVSSYDMVFGFVDNSGNHIPGLVETHDKLKTYIQYNQDTWNIVREMIGIQRQKSVHPCGIVIADRPVQAYCPIINVNDTKATGYSPKSIERAGLVKYDILGLETLSDIQRCLKLISERHQITLNPWNLPHDQETFDEFCAGHTETVFQFDTETVRPYLIDIKPRSIDDLAAITALCRPGTLNAPSEDGRPLSKVFVARSNGEIVNYVHPDLEPILNKTLGIQLYQEQTIRIFRELANYSAADAEEVRRGIGKKDEKLLIEATTKLKEHCLKRGWDIEQTKLLVRQIMASAKYSFNCSHATSYAYVAYACMYLKTKFPLEWWCATLSNATQTEISNKYWKYVSHIVDMPNINSKTVDFEIVGKKLVAPLSIIKGVGEAVYNSITEHAPYSDLNHFVGVHLKQHPQGQRHPVHTGIVQKLVITGALDSLFPPEDDILEKKLYRIAQIKAEIRNERPQPVPPEFTGITDLGRYLIKKELIPIYSIDLRDIMLPSRGGFKIKSQWVTQDKKPVLSAEQLAVIRERAREGLWCHAEFYCLGYVVEEIIILYQNKTKRATKLLLDIGGTFIEEVWWPNRDSDTSPSGFKRQPVMVMYWSTPDRVGVKKVFSLLPVTNNYSVV